MGDRCTQKRDDPCDRQRNREGRTGVFLFEADAQCACPNGKEFPMGELIDKAKGVANEAIGRGKQAAADRNRDADQKAEGQAQELKGKGQQLKGSVKGAFGNKI